MSLIHTMEVKIIQFKSQKSSHNIILKIIAYCFEKVFAKVIKMYKCVYPSMYFNFS